ncbi:MAG: hypothetical protein HC877_09165 [Thioploca sp.]|nr:hypothetical protein [Thioploca sp.]
MAYTDFKDIYTVFQKYGIKAKTENIFPSRLHKDVPDWFCENLTFALEIKKIHESEAFCREGFIYPFLQEGVKLHRHLNLWSHQLLSCDEELNGYPDYFITALPYEHAYLVMDKPYVAVVEAKDEKLNEGWGQCLAEMVACQKLNEPDDIPVYGIVSTGILWEFAKLDGNTFLKHRSSYTVEPPELLMGILDYVLTECEQYAQKKI